MYLNGFLQLKSITYCIWEILSFYKILVKPWDVDRGILREALENVPSLCAALDCYVKIELAAARHPRQQDTCGVTSVVRQMFASWRQHTVTTNQPRNAIPASYTWTAHANLTRHPDTSCETPQTLHVKRILMYLRRTCKPSQTPRHFT
jgi:hypothetical protein